MADSLLFIPDISGFTEFVNATAVEHGRHIIAELLELIIDSDELDLTVAEIEGDAVLFYKQDSVPTVAEIADQAERLFVNFHAHLKKYETHRICECGACRSAHQLTLKIVAHKGPIEFLQVKGFNKPYGSDLILVHRLLKNDIPNREYLLVSDHLIDSDEMQAGPSDWLKWENGFSEYDTIGKVDYCYSLMEGLHDRVPDPPPAPTFAPMDNPLVVEGMIEADIDTLYRVVTDFGERLSWNDGVDDFVYEPDVINRAGTHHQCIVNGKTLDFETVTADFGDNKTVYGEKLEDIPIVKEAAFFYIMTPNGETTHLRMEGHYHSKPFPMNLPTPLFRLITKRQLADAFRKIKRATEAYTGS